MAEPLKVRPNSPTAPRWIPLGVLFLTLVVVAYGFDGSAEAVRPGVPTPALLPLAPTLPSSTAVGAPAVIIVSPWANAIITGGAPLTVSFEVWNFTLAPFNGSSNAPGTGQLDVAVDGELYEVVSQVAPIALPLAPGPHNVSLSLVNDGAVVSSPTPQSYRNVEMTEGPNTGKPGVVIWTPSNGGTVQGDVATLSFYLANFAIVPPVGQPNAPNEGHVHAYLDGQYFAMITAEQAFLLTGLSPGSHSLELVLVNNDHTPYQYEGSTQLISATTNFTVVAAATSSTITGAQAELLEVSSFATLGVSLLVLVAVVLLRAKGGGRRDGPSPPAKAASPTKSSPIDDDRE